MATPAPRRPGHLRLGRHCHGRHAVSALRDDELDEGARPGRRHRCRRRPARHDDPAARAARGVRALDLLAGASDYGSVDTPRRFLGARRTPDREGPAPHLGGHVAAAGRRVARDLPVKATGLENKDVTTDARSIVGEQVVARHFPAGTGSPVMVLANADEAAAVKTKLEAGRRRVHRRRPGHQGRAVAHHGHPRRRPRLRRSDGDRRPDPRRHRHVSGADAIAGGDTATSADTLRASATTTCGSSRSILGVVLLILILLLRALTAPLILVATVVLSYGAAMGLSALIFRHVLGLRRVQTPRCRSSSSCSSSRWASTTTSS